MDTMKNIVKEIIELAEECTNSGEIDIGYNLAEIAEKLIAEMALTINCPSNWRNIGEELAEEYNGNNWVIENCKLYEYEE